MLSLTSEEKRKKWSKLAMGVGFGITTLFLIKMFAPILWAVPEEYMCRVGETMCGKDVCTYMGNWHQAWRLPLLGFIPLGLYSVPVFILPIFYGSWRASLYHFLLGPTLAYVSTADHNEYPAIWCLFSIVLLTTIFSKQVRKHLRLESDIPGSK
jgi:hypothetical protein